MDATNVTISVGENVEENNGYQPIINLVTTKTVNPTSGTVGDTVVFTITVTNSGPSQATDVSLVDTLSGGLTLIGVSASHGSYVEPNWVIGTLNNAEVAELNLSMTID